MKSDVPRATAPARRKFRGLAVLVILAAAAWPYPRPGAAAGGCLVDEPADYRMARYRSETPCTLAGAQVVTTAEVRRLVDTSPAVLVDVLPSPRRPATLADDGLWAPPPHENIPGSAWLPNTGFGAPPVEELAYLRDNLRRLTGGDEARALLFYCEARCWMSWNAARRAVSWGYTGVRWYPDGTDGWLEAGLILVDAEPVRRDVGH